jgi:predicted XRE-type DNA-binding protein
LKKKITRSSGNVFLDLGFPPEEAEHLKVRSDLMIHLCKVIKSQGLKQAEAAKMLGVTQPRISDLFQGRIQLFSVDTLIDMLARAGIQVKLVVTPRKRKLKVA